LRLLKVIICFAIGLQLPVWDWVSEIVCFVSCDKKSK
jgi:hypothetical protein